MNQLTLFDATPRWTVTELTRYMRQLFEADTALKDVWVQGEISNLARPSSGHIYFTLKDKGASLKCVMWKGDAIKMRLALQDGMSIEAHGYVSIYEPGGQYQLYVNIIKPVGEGALYAEFMRLKALLETEGLFDPARKRPIPQFPKRIGIVTSPTGAALRDMLNVLRRRLPLAEVILAPSPVQGDEAPAALVLALKNLNQIAHPDVILMARGGGSIEDLWAFNDERVVRAVASSPVPVISGVGHETDFTLTDFAADLRAPTPTAAAELSTPVKIEDLLNNLNYFKSELDSVIFTTLDERKNNLDTLYFRLRQFSPVRKLQTERQRVDDLARRASYALDHRLELAHSRLNGMTARLESLSPLAVLARGYAVVTRQGGELIHNAAQVRAGDELNIRVVDGSFGAKVQ